MRTIPGDTNEGSQVLLLELDRVIVPFRSLLQNIDYRHNQIFFFGKIGAHVGFLVTQQSDYIG